MIQERLKDTQQNPHIQRMQADGGFVKDKNRIGLCFSNFAGKLQSLCLAAGQSGRFFAKCQVAEAKLPENPKLLADPLHILAEVECGVHIHVHQLRQGNARTVFISEPDCVSGLVIAGPAAVRAGNVDIRQELHVETDNAGSVAAGAAK